MSLPPRTRGPACAAVIAAALLLAADPVHALTGEITSPREMEVFIDPEITISGAAAVESGEWALRDRRDFENGTFSGLVFQEGAGLRLTTLFRDDFDGTSLSSERWTLYSGGGIAEAVGAGGLRLSGTESAQVWGGTELRSNARFTGSISLYARIAAGGTGTGYGLNFGIIAGEDLFFRCGPLCDNARDRNSLLYVNYMTGGGGEGIQSDDDRRNLDSEYHSYGLVYNATSGNVGVYIDGALKANKTWMADVSGYAIFIAGWGRMNGDTLDGKVEIVHCGFSRGSYISPPRPVESPGLFLRSMAWNATEPAQTHVAGLVRTCDASGAASTWQNAGGQGAALPVRDWLQFRLDLSTDDPWSTPAVLGTTLRWSPEVVSAESSLDGARWAPLNGTYNWSGRVVLHNGQNNISVRLRDTIGDSATLNRSVWLAPESEVPKGSVVINSGDEYTTSARVTLRFSVGPGPAVRSMKVSNTGELASLPWVPYSGQLEWDLGGADGLRTVHAVLLSVDGIPSRPFSDSIILDTTPPEVWILRPHNGSEHHRSRIDVRGTARDMNGVVSVELRVDGGPWTACGGLAGWNASAALPTRSAHLIEACATDAAGHSNKTSVWVRRTPAPSRSVLPAEWSVAALVLVATAAFLAYWIWRSRRAGPD